MICTQCEGEIPSAATECPHCGAAVESAQTITNDAPLAEPAGPGAMPSAPFPGANVPGPVGTPAGVPGSAARSGSTLQFNFDAKRWSQADRIVGGATLVLLISLFLPWFSYRFGVFTYSWDGLVHGYLYITLLICLGILAYLVALAGFETLPFKMPIGHEAAILIATVVNLLLTFIGFIDKPYGFGVGWSFGSFLALVAAVVAAAPLGLPVIKAARKPKQ
jgi:hypothetical protein